MVLFVFLSKILKRWRWCPLKNKTEQKREYKVIRTNGINYILNVTNRFTDQILNGNEREKQKANR